MVLIFVPPPQKKRGVGPCLLHLVRKYSEEKPSERVKLFSINLHPTQLIRCMEVIRLCCWMTRLQFLSGMGEVFYYHCDHSTCGARAASYSPDTKSYLKVNQPELESGFGEYSKTCLKRTLY